MKITLTNDEARALHWFLRHMTFTDYENSVPPHLPNHEDKAYELRNLLYKVEQQLPCGDSWMYRRTAA